MTALASYSEAARMFATDVPTISGLVRAYGLIPKPIPTNARAKGLDARDLRVIAKALNRPMPKLAAVS